jgi:transcriptional antiterminator NusG
MGLVQSGFTVWRPIEAFDEVRRGRRVEITRNLFVRYIFVGFAPQSRFDMLRDTHGVEAILGAAGCPMPIRAALLQAVADEIAGAEIRTIERSTFAVGQLVRILTGPFASFPGEIEETDEAKQRAGVAVNIFGRKTPVELDFIQLEAA